MATPYLEDPSAPRHSAVQLYRPLRIESQEIRLLKIASETEAASATIICSLRHACLLDGPTPAYETVSYCWGKASDQRDIVLDGDSFAIPASAEQALRQLRRTDGPRLLWIDALCIDQKNNVERGHQEALHLIGLVIEDIKRETTDVGRTLQDAVFTEHGQYRYSDTGMSFVADFKPILDLFERPWFSRLWVLQEAVLAPSNTCHCGASQFGLLDVLRAARWLKFKQLHVPVALVRSKGRVHAILMWDLIERKRGTQSEQSRTNIGKVLERNRVCEATEPRDFIFGILGLVTHPSSLDRRSKLLTPDYYKSLVNVYRDATLFALKEGGTLWVWQCISHRGDREPDSEGFPSWVPQYNRNHRAKWDPEALGSMFAAADNIPTCGISLEPDYPTTLIISGVLIDRISQAASPVFTNQIDGDADASLRLLLDIEAIVSAEAWARDYEAVERAVSFTLIGGRNGQRAPASESDCLAYQAYKAYVRQKHETPPTIRKVDSSTDPDTSSASQWRWAYKQAATKRRFFVTNEGLIGMGPRQVTSGDVVATLYGGMWPFILRPCDNHYVLLGPAYINGIMNGEAVRKHKASERSDDVFRIR